MKRITAKEVALSGVTAALAVIAVVLSYYVQPATVAFYAISSVCLSLPLLGGSGRGAVLAFVASAALCFLFVGYIHFLPYALMFGPYPILFYYLRKYVKKTAICLPVKILFANGTFFACFFLTGLTFEDFPILDPLPTFAKYLILVLGLTLGFVIFDYAFGILFASMEKRFGKILGNSR